MNHEQKITQPRPIAMALSILPAFALVLIVLKLTGRIDWHWMWVLAPLAFHFLVCVIFVVAATFLAWARLFGLIADLIEDFVGSTTENKNV